MGYLDLKYKIIAKNENDEASEVLVVQSSRQFDKDTTQSQQINHLEGKSLLIEMKMNMDKIVVWEGSINWLKNKMHIFRTGLIEHDIDETSKAMYESFLQQCSQATLITWQELEGILLNEEIEYLKQKA